MEVQNQEECNRILKEVFGDSSSESQSEEDDDDIETPNNNNPPFEWIKIKEIKGLWLFKDFLSLQQQASLLSAIKNEGWFSEEKEEEPSSQNQAMRFGDLPSWAIQLSNSIRETICFNQDGDGDGDDVLPANLLWREPLFDQLIANAYQPGEGICAHIDLMRFEDGIAIVSLESECVMHFTRLEMETNASDCIEKGEENEDRQPFITKIPVLLTPGSLIVMSGEARYRWKHEINRKPGFQVWGGQEIRQQKRISVTLRKLCETK